MTSPLTTTLLVHSGGCFALDVDFLLRPREGAFVGWFPGSPTVSPGDAPAALGGLSFTNAARGREIGRVVYRLRPTAPSPAGPSGQLMLVAGAIWAWRARAHGLVVRRMDAPLEASARVLVGSGSLGRLDPGRPGAPVGTHAIGAVTGWAEKLGHLAAWLERSPAAVVDLLVPAGQEDEVLDAAKATLPRARRPSDQVRALLFGETAVLQVHPVATTADVERVVESLPDDPAADDTAGWLRLLDRRGRAVAAGEDPAEIERDLSRAEERLFPRGHLARGDRLGGGRYELLRRLGEGESASVWEAWDGVRTERVAVKILHPHHAADPERVDRFVRSARQLASLAHPALARVSEPAGADGRHRWFAMELLDGGSLDARVRAGDLGPEEVLRAVREVASALAFAHAQGVVHGAVEPAHVLFDDRGGARLIDLDGPSADRGTVALGSVPYRAPEVLTRIGGDRRAADQYGLAMTALWALSGGRLDGDALRDPREHLHLARASVALRRRLARALHPRPERRFPSLGDLEVALRDPSRIALPWLGRTWRAGLGSAAAVLALAGAAAVVDHRATAPLEEALALELAAARLAEAAPAESLALLRAAAWVGGGDDAAVDAPRVRGLSRRGAAEVRVPVGSAVTELEPTPDGSAFVVGTLTGDLVAIEAASGRVRWRAHVHDARVRELDGSPDGRWIAALAGDPRMTTNGVFPAVLVDAATGARGATLGRSGVALRAVWALDSETVAVHFDDGRIEVWTPAGRPVGELTRSAYAVLALPDGGWVVSSAAGQERRGEDGRVRWQRVGDGLGGGPLARLAKVGAVACADARGVRALDLEDGHVVAELVTAAAELVASSDGDRLVTGDHVAWRLWSTDPPVPIQDLDEHRGRIYDASFATVGSILASVGEDSVIRRWDADSGRALAPFVVAGEPTLYAVAWGTGGEGTPLALAAGGEGEVVHLWADTTPAGLVRTHRVSRTALRDVAWDVEHAAALVLRSDGVVSRVDLATGAEVELVDAPLARRLSFARETGRVFVRGLRVVEVVAVDGSAAPVQHPVDFDVYRVQPSADGRVAAILGVAHQLVFWHDGGAQTVVGLDPGVAPQAIVFSPDDATAYIGTRQGSVEAWEVATGTRLAVLPGPDTGTSSLKISADGTTLAGAGWDGHVAVWDLPAHTLRWAAAVADTEVWRVTFAPDGASVFASDGEGTVTVLDAVSGERTVRLPGEGSENQLVAVSPDGLRVATGGATGRVGVWDTRTGHELAVLDHGGEDVTDGAFSPDGRWLYTAAGDGSLRVWDAEAARRPPPTVASTGAWTNLRVCRSTLEVVAVVDAEGAPVSSGPEAASVWAPAGACSSSSP